MIWVERQTSRKEANFSLDDDPGLELSDRFGVGYAFRVGLSHEFLEVPKASNSRCVNCSNVVGSRPSSHVSTLGFPTKS
jgi:hypothetical protein